ncbi:hypothetical protein ABID39_001032 [Bartonella japonica]|uniref:Uncharacterized protein n=1 Tax=Bartonella japonica TaxID=357761 RepID=A0ABV2FP70_9HYPH
MIDEATQIIQGQNDKSYVLFYYEADAQYRIYEGKASLAWEGFLACWRAFEYASTLPKRHFSKSCLRRQKRTRSGC